MSTSGNTLTLDPSSLLGNAAGYSVEFAAGSVVDLAGNPYAGTTSFKFTTVAANQTINGSASAVSLIGGTGNDTINGMASNDVLTGGGGNDRLDGVSGTDMAMFSGTRASYFLASAPGGYEVTDDNPSRDGWDTVLNMEVLRFSDMSVDLLAGTHALIIPAASLKTLEELYVGFFNRIPEAPGLGYWIDQLSSGVSMASIANQFYDAGVQFGLYPSGMTNDAFIREIYKNVLGRPPGVEPTQPEIAYWDNRLTTGQDSKGTMVLQMLSDVHSFFEGITDTSHPNYPYQFVAAHLNNKALVADYYAVQQGLSLNVQADNIAFGVELASLITPTDTSAALALVGVNEFSTV